VPEDLYVFPLRLRNRKASDNFSGVSLKKWFQSRGVAPWLREAWPVVDSKAGCFLLGVN
jgi:tRNA(Ile)-lysidine synthetase-like protein